MCNSNFHCVLMYKIDSRWDDYSISFFPVTVSMSMRMSSGIVQFNFMSTPPHARWVWRRKRRGGGGGRRTGETLTRGMGTDCGRKDLMRGVRRPVSVQGPENSIGQCVTSYSFVGSYHSQHVACCC